MAFLNYDQLEQKFKIGQVLGRGEFGVVRTCIQRESPHNQYAFKLATYDTDYLKDSNWSWMLSEIDLLMKLDHPCIVQMFYYLFYERKSFRRNSVEVGIVIERGIMTLEDFIRREKKNRGFINPQVVQGFIINALHMMTYMHSQNIVHRDIKPTNIIITSIEPLEFKLIDFGLGAQISDNEVCRGLFFGTYSYASPQMKRNYNNEAQGVKTTHVVNYFKNDVYCLGQTLLSFASCTQQCGNVSTNDKLNKVRDFYGQNSYIYLAIDAMIQNTQQPRPFASDLLSKSQVYFQNLRNSQEQAEPTAPIQNDGPTVFDCFDDEQNNYYGNYNYNYIQAPTTSTQQIDYKNTQIDHNYQNINKSDSFYNQQQHNEQQFMNPINKTDQQQLQQIEASYQKPCDPPKNYQFTESPTQFDFGVETVCSKAFQDFIFLGLKNGDLGVISNNKHYIFEIKSDVIKSQIFEITHMDVKDNTLWTSTTTSRFILWNIIEIRVLLRDLQDSSSRLRFMANSLPQIVQTNICYYGPEFEAMEKGISSFAFFYNFLIVGYSCGYLKIIKDDIQIMSKKAYSNPIVSFKCSGEYLFSVCARGILKRTNLSMMITDKLYIPSSLDKRVLSIYLRNTQILAVTEKGLATIDFNLRLLDYQQLSAEQQILYTSQSDQSRLCMTSTGRMFVNEQKVAEYRDWYNISSVYIDKNLVIIGTTTGMVNVLRGRAVQKETF